MLSIRERQTYLKKLGYYSGTVDGIEGAKTKAAYKAFQEAYGLKVDGIYGSKTNSKLKEVCREIYKVDWNQSKYFKKYEFKCNCGGKYCNGYPAEIDPQLVINLNKLREKFGKPVTITSGLRCKKYNNSLPGSSATSRHMRGKAVDIYIPGVTNTEAGRKKVMAYWKRLNGYGYTYCNIGGNHPNMGNAVHVDVK